MADEKRNDRRKANRILILCNSFSGLYKFRKELIENLLPDHEVILSGPRNEYAARFEEMGCVLTYAEMARRKINPVRDVFLFFRYLVLMLRWKPACVLTYTIKPNIFGGIAASIARRPYLANITGLGTAYEKKGSRRFFLSVYRYAIRNAACVFFQNEHNRQLFSPKGIFAENHRLIPGSGVNLDFFKVTTYPTGKVTRFLFVARIFKEKGIDQYLEAAEKIKKLHPDTEFHIVGDCDDEYKDILAAYEKNSIILYHGRQDDMRPYYAMTDCMVHPTYYNEGMSNVLLEAAASGRPVITTRQTGCLETVDVDKSGFLFEPKNTSELIETIERFLSKSFEERKSMGLAGREKMEKEFNREYVIGAYLEEIRKIMPYKRSHEG